MAANYWTSSHHKRWVVDRTTVQQARAVDRQYVDDPQHIELLNIFFGNAISKLGRKLSLRQRAIATATVFFRRFYLKNHYCETDPLFVAAACCYVAAKAEESPLHLKTVASEARIVFGKEDFSHKSFPPEPAKLAEMEFYLMEDLGCDLAVFHPYRTLLSLCCTEGGGTPAATERELGEYGAPDEDSQHYWGSGAGKLELPDGTLQLAWFIINDSYRSDVCLLHPPHLVAIAALVLAVSQHSETRDAYSPDAAGASAPRDIVGFLAGLNVSMPAVTSAVQDLLALYAVWARVRDEGGADISPGLALAGSARGALAGHSASPAATSGAGVTSAQLAAIAAAMRERWFARLGAVMGQDKRLSRTFAAG